MSQFPTKSEEFERVITLYDRKINYEIKNFENNPSEIEDLKQEVYIKIFRNFLNLNEKLNPWAWIRTVTVNHCINHLRKKSKCKVYNFQASDNVDILDTLPDEKFQFKVDTESEYIQKMIYNTVKRLDDKFREVIILYDFENLSYEQIAKKISCPVGTVKSRLFRARMQLKEELKEFMDL